MSERKMSGLTGNQNGVMMIELGVTLAIVFAAIMALMYALEVEVRSIRRMAVSIQGRLFLEGELERLRLLVEAGKTPSHAEAEFMPNAEIPPALKKARFFLRVEKTENSERLTEIRLRAHLEPPSSKPEIRMEALVYAP